jgi:hypothetical protein
MPHEKKSTGHPTPRDTRTVLKGMLPTLKGAYESLKGRPYSLKE